MKGKLLEESTSIGASFSPPMSGTWLGGSEASAQTAQTLGGTGVPPL